MKAFITYIRSWGTALKSLTTGMSVTFKNFFRKPITEFYPENRVELVMSDRFKAILTMPHNEHNEHKCTACGICEMNCPNGTIRIVSRTEETEDGKKRKVLEAHEYYLGQCSFCNLCVLTCPSQAIVFEKDFEQAIFTKSKLHKKLNNEGSKLMMSIKG